MSSEALTGLVGSAASIPVLSPAPRRSAVQVLRSTPTLIGSETPGSQGAVRVWAPRRSGVEMPLAAGGFLALVGLYGIALGHGELGMALLLLYVVGLCFWMVTEPHPYYFTTDDAGIGLTTHRGTRAFRWSEIRSILQVTPGDALTYWISLKGGGGVRLRLHGHTRQSRQALLALITDYCNPS